MVPAQTPQPAAARSVATFLLLGVSTGTPEGCSSLGVTSAIAGDKLDPVERSPWGCTRCSGKALANSTASVAACRHGRWLEQTLTWVLCVWGGAGPRGQAIGVGQGALYLRQVRWKQLIALGPGPSDTLEPRGCLQTPSEWGQPAPEVPPRAKLLSNKIRILLQLRFTAQRYLPAWPGLPAACFGSNH